MRLSNPVPFVKPARIAFAAALATLLTYLPMFANGFTNWDDDLYVTANRFVQRLTAENVAHHFTSFTSGNYHPLTLIAHSLICHFFGADPRAFHGVSLLLHLLNVLLVYHLCARLGASALGAGFAALLFGVHPLHVESVAWVSELKDVQSAFFFLAAVAAYLEYSREPRRSAWYALSLGLCLLSLLSKSMGVTLPLVLLLVDFLRGRRVDATALRDKAPFFLLALLFGTLALLSQNSAVRSGDGFGLGENLLVAAHGVLFYLGKAIAPVDLSALYLIPVGVNGRLPPAFTFAPLPLLVLAAAIAALGRRSKTLVFSSLFFLVTLLPVLQIVPVGIAAAADRYFYLPSFGLCFGAGMALQLLAGAQPALSAWRPRLALLGAAVLLLIFAAAAHERIRVWKDSVSLWDDVLAKAPDSYIALGYRGMAHAAAGAVEPALADFQRALDVGGDRLFSAEVYYNRGALLQRRQQYREALADYDRALALDPRAVKALVNRGNVRDTLGRPEEALSDYGAAIAVDPGNPLPYFNRGLVHHRLGDAPQAVFDYGQALERDPWFAPAYEHRSRAYADLGDRRRADADRERARAVSSGASRP